MVAIGVRVFAIVLINFAKKGFSRFEGRVSHHEVVFTLVPFVVLIIIGVPSLLLLYSLEQEVESALTVKVEARQWY